MIRVVVDTNVVVSAAIRPRGVPGRILYAAARGRLRLVASPELVADIDEVLHRDKFADRISPSIANRLLLLFRQGAEIHYGADLRPAGLTRDPDDDYLVHLYRYARADRLVTGDRDLLEADLPDVELRSPSAFLGELDQE